MSQNETLQPCPDCGREISTSATACPNCGRKLKSTPINILAMIILCAIGVSIAIPFFGAIVGALDSGTTIKGHLMDGPKNKDGVYCDRNGHWHGL
jgi:hypothetical protein